MQDDADTHRLLAQRFGADAVRGRRVITAWRETSPADWCVAVVAGEDGLMLLEAIESPEESFTIREPLAEHGIDRVFVRLMRFANAAADSEARVEMVRRYATLLDAFAFIDPDADELPAALTARAPEERDWVVEELRRMGRGDAPIHGLLPSGRC